MKEISVAYNDLIVAGVEAEDARYLLPNATATNIVVTMNYRELVNFCRVRLCYRAQWEIFDMTKLMKKAIKEVAPFLADYLLPKCQHLGYCEETEPCGKYKFPPESDVVKTTRKGF
jgi:thymidylate synthase (FAD)